jgi:hypothetical protein
LKDKIIDYIKSNPTVALTILTAYSWFCAYNYQVGFCSFFSVPSEYIDISTIDILKFVSSILGISFVMYNQFYDIFKSWVHVSNQSMKQLILSFLIFATLFGYWILYFIAKLPLTIYYLYAGLASVILILIILNRRKTHVEEDTNRPMKTAPSFWYMYGLLLIVPLFCLYVGYGNASKKTYFEVLSEHKSVAVIRRFGDNIILKNFNSKTQQFGDSIFVIKLGPTNPLNLVNVKLLKE